jgi:hypothetical protein
VIGGLIFATVSTLFFVPVVFSIIHRHYGPNRRRKPTLEKPMSQPDRDTGRPVPRGCAWSAAHLCFSPSVLLAYGLATRAAQNSRLRELTEAQAVPTSRS